MQYPLPPGGNGAGAPARDTQDTAGALGKGVQFSVAIGLLFLYANTINVVLPCLLTVCTFSFLAYIIPIFSGWLADSKMGRYRVILIGV